MRRAIPILALAAIAGMALAGCDRPSTPTASNDSRVAALVAAPSPSTSTAVPDRASPNAPAAASLERPEGGMKAAVAETVTTGKIKAAIAAESGMKDSDVSVSTTHGVVTLSGTVKSQDQVTIATNLAQRQEGVGRVESQLAVR
jgi:hyperosmotically inducible periplasmic protein